MRIGSRGFAAGALALAALALGGGVAQAQAPVLENGKTKAVYDYKQATRERVFIPQTGIDQDANGAMDWITIDIIRPKEAAASNKMPAIIDPSPYYTTSCRGNESQCMADWNNDSVNDRWPLFYDNYFVPRGYAYILAQMNGTAYTTNGCPMHGGAGDIAGEKSVVDWLNGRAPGYTAADLNSTPKLADWHNGSSAMIGKSYDGTLANGVAATGVEGLKTIVPVSAISAWYNYSRTAGIRHNDNYAGGLNNTVTTGTNPPAGVTLPSRRTLCAPQNTIVNGIDGDEHGDINPFWLERDYNKDVSKVKAAVFATHGIQDDNVRMDHMWLWWNGLKANNVPRKLWLLRAGHTDPFESRRAEWVTTLHRWFDHYLYAVNNGIETEPAVTIEDSKDVWGNYTDWPIPGTKDVDLFLRGTSATTAGTLGGGSGGATDSVSYTQTGSSTQENTIISTPAGQQATRRVFLSRPLTKDIRMSGTAMIDLQASLSTTQSNLGAVLVDYGAGTQTSRGGEGISNRTNRTCWGETGVNALTGEAGPACNIGEACTASAREVDTACYLEVDKPTQDVTQWRVTRGVLDSSNRTSYWFENASPVTIGEKYNFKFPTQATEHIFKAGHQIGIVLVTNLYGAAGTPGSVVTVDTKLSKLTLPLVGGYKAAVEAGVTDAETVAPVISNMPADITVSTANPQGVVVNYALPTATDNEDANPTVTCSKASGSLFAVGQNTVVCTARDANGNTSTKTFTIMVLGLSDVGGSVPATLSLSLAAPASFGAFVPGVTRTYETSVDATVISTAGNALLSVADPSSVGTGHLVNGTFVLPQPLQARARNAANTGTAYNNVGSSASPLNLLTYAAPISNDAVALQFSQLVNSTDPLRTGSYSKALTFTLSTTQP
jgi:X-Pro dipeptidyl-peptidase